MWSFAVFCGLGRKGNGVKGSWQEAIEPVEALRREVPSSKTGFIRGALPEIERALAQGHSLKRVWQRFRDGGLDVQYKHFCIYVARVRSRQKRRVEFDGEQGQVSGTKLATAKEASTTHVVPHDPLVNWRRVEASRPGFHYRGTEDLEELVYGDKRKRGKQ